MKEKSPDQVIQDHRMNITREIEHWKHINQYGCNDPYWPDGCNMNLTRNHVIYAKNEISRLCGEKGITLPEEYYLPTPPEVDKNYMANLKQAERVKRIRQFGSTIMTKKTEYDDSQMSIFDIPEVLP